MLKGGGGSNSNFLSGFMFDLGLDMDFGVEVCPDILLAGLSILGAGFFFFLNDAIINKGRRKRCSNQLFHEYSATLFEGKIH